MTASRILLIRHGETAWNAERRWQGKTNIPLNGKGQVQAQAVAKRLKSEPFDRIISSDLQRAWQTTQIIAAPHNLTPIPDPRLQEIGFGDWEGMTFPEIEALFPKQLAAWFDDAENAPPNGERISKIFQRVQTAWHELTQLPGTTVVVAHGGIIRLILCHVLGLPASSHWQFSLENTSISEIKLFDKGPVLHRLNDASHLS